MKKGVRTKYSRNNMAGKPLPVLETPTRETFHKLTGYLKSPRADSEKRPETNTPISIKQPTGQLVPSEVILIELFCFWDFPALPPSPPPASAQVFVRPTH